MDLHATNASTTELERIGDAIAELSAHLDAASARLLDLIRDFDARGGWNNGFRSCAEWLSWRVGLDLGRRPREGPRGPRPRHAAAARPGARPRRAVVRQGPRPHARGDAGHRGAVARHRPRRHGRSTWSASSAAGDAWIAKRRSDEASPAARKPSASRVSRMTTAPRRSADASSPEAGALLAEGADGGTRSPVLSGSAPSTRRRAAPRTPPAETPTMAQQQADALAAPRRDRAAPRHRSRARRPSTTRWSCTSTPRY